MPGQPSAGLAALDEGGARVVEAEQLGQGGDTDQRGGVLGEESEPGGGCHGIQLVAELQASAIVDAARGGPIMGE